MPCETMYWILMSPFGVVAVPFGIARVKASNDYHWNFGMAVL